MIASPKKLALAGLVIGAAYLAVVWLSVSMGWIASRPLYDGLVPLPPYRWIAPPAERAKDNQVPQPETFKVAIKPDGTTDPSSVTSGDGQATLTLDHISPLKGTAFTVTMTPMDAAAVAAAPQGNYFDGNAYKIDATYDGTAEPVEGSFSVVLRYSVHARQMLSLDGGAWKKLFQPLATAVDMQVSARTPRLGTFVSSGEGTRPATGTEHSDDPSPLPSAEPYRWIEPPASRSGDNKVPGKESFDVHIDEFGQTEVTSVTTSDGQAEATFSYVPPTPGLASVQMQIEPKDPASLAPAPEGQRFEGNAYTFSAAFPNGSEASTIPTGVTLRFLDQARHLMELRNGRWVEVAAPNFAPGVKLIAARSDGPGTFVATANVAVQRGGSNANGPLAWIFGVGALVVLVAVAIPMSRKKSKPEIVKTDPDKI